MLPNTALVMFEGATNFPLIAIPMFILAGAIMNASSISRRLMDLASALVGFIRGGLAMVTIGASMFFAEISGSAVADVAAIGSIIMPANEARGILRRIHRRRDLLGGEPGHHHPAVHPDEFRYAATAQVCRCRCSSPASSPA